MDVWTKHQMTAVMVTHDVDEALFLSDRIVLMTSGPNAHVGEVIGVPFKRPRDRDEVLAHPEYYQLRERLIGFLESQAHAKPPVAEKSAASDQVAMLPLAELA